MITILTPTYNRAYILNNAYESLCRQTQFDFEWIIVDDGSTDNTEELVAGWISTCEKFNIKYYKQKNGGKHRAVNFGVNQATTEYILILDSDDFLADNACEKIHEWIKTIDGLSDFAGVSGLKGYIGKQQAVGGEMKSEYIDATNIQRRKYGLLGDKAEIYRTQIMKKYPFPEFEGEKFLRETASWDAIAEAGYKIRWFNEIIYLCNYLEDGLTKNAGLKVYTENFKGYTFCTKLYVKNYPFLYSCFKIGQYRSVAMLINKTDKEICGALEIGPLKLLIGRMIYFVKNLIKK